MKIRAIIVDDEINNRENLHALLREYCPDVEVVGLADSAETAYWQITSRKPDLVFLDIRMPGKDGFQLLESLGAINFEIIIVTAYNEYAIRAIKFCAIDYLLKPIDIPGLAYAVENVSLRLAEKQEHERMRQLVNNLASNERPTKIGLTSLAQVEFVEISRISRCASDNNYTHVFLDNGNRRTISKTLKEFDEMLGEYGFLRVHQSHLVNTAYIKSVEKSSGGSIVMNDGTEIPVSRARRNKIIGLIKSAIKILAPVLSGHIAFFCYSGF